MFLRKLHCAWVCVLAFGTANAAGAAELAVVVSARTPVMVLHTDQVAEIFLAEANRFPDGREAVPIDQQVGTAVRDAFYEKVVGRSPAMMKAYWTKLFFTGRGVPPQEAAGDAAVKKLVAENPGMIGYIDRAALDATVRAVLLVH